MSTRVRRCGLGLLGALVLWAGALDAQDRRLIVTGPTGNPLAEAVPAFSLVTSGFVASDLPLTLRLQVSFTADFSGALFADTTVSASFATIVIPRLLPERRNIWWRAVATTAVGLPVTSDIFGPRQTPTWLTLISPNSPNGTTVGTRRPVFTWASPRISPPVAGWMFEIRILRSQDGVPVRLGQLRDTTFAMTEDLESNTSYRWTVAAWLPGGPDTVRVASAASFVILSDDSPLATLLYQNFPNPFPSPTVQATCVWFDLKAGAKVDLSVLDLRGNRVRILHPTAGGDPTLPAGRYGRAAVGGAGGCDERFTWDGRSEDGRDVPPGVYLLRLRAGGVESFRRVVFRGR